MRPGSGTSVKPREFRRAEKRLCGYSGRPGRNGSTASASNFPTGRHSRYSARTVAQNGWQRLKFLLDDRLDGGTADTAVNRMVLPINPNSCTGDTYHLDNDAIHAR